MHDASDSANDHDRAALERLVRFGGQKLLSSMIDIYREQGRTADYMTMLEMEAAAVARTRDPARLAELESEMSQLFLNHFARLERVVRNPQRAGKLAQEHVRSRTNVASELEEACVAPRREDDGCDVGDRDGTRTHLRITMTTRT